MDEQRITLSLDNLTDGRRISPDEVRLGDLARFSEDVKTFLQGDGKEVDAHNILVSIEHGSLALSTPPIPVDMAPKLFSDLKSLGQIDIIDRLDSKRQAVIDRWQKSARGVTGLIYKIATPFLQRPVVISANSDYRFDDSDAWVRVERYITGEVQDLGGSRRPNAHLKLPNGKTLKVVTDRELLRDDKHNRLYKNAVLRVRAEYNIHTGDLRDARLIGFVEYSQDIDEDALERMKERGAKAWKGVESASSWVDDLRGE